MKQPLQPSIQSIPRKPTNWCSHCHVPTTEMICLVCGKATDPLITTGRLRPVFRQEIELMERLTGVALLRNPQDLVLWRSGRDYYAAGRKVARIFGVSTREALEVQVFDSELWAVVSGHRRGRKPGWLRRDPQETVFY
ncbi:MAG: hypothetical protein ACUVX8_04455 [Candidatus Zipacnadales bacterium]